MPNGEPKPIQLEEESEVEIKVMPEQFYFKKMPKEARVSKAPPEGASGEKPKMTLIIVMVVVVIGLMAGAAYLFTQSLKKAPQPMPSVNVAANVPPTNTPSVNTPPVNVPPLPVCGNGVCETGENSTTCPTDCPPPPPLPQPPAPAELPLAADADQDGLTDTEEILFSTNAANLDTDNDSYRDGLEVINLYNPTGFAPQKIEETALVKIYSNSTYHYTIFYPATWLARALDETNQEAMFTSATGEFMQVIVEENPNRLPLLDWYLAESPGTSPAEVGTATTKIDMVIGVKSPDGLTVYFGKGDKIYAISYNTGIKTELNYKSAFEMMVKSFKLSL